MRRIALAVLLAGTSLAVAAPAGALSCAPPEPVDWEARFPRLEVALIVQIDSVNESTDGTFAGSLQISATVVEVLKGEPRTRIDYEVPSLNPWGPFYEVGDVVAVIIERGTISDGRQNICGPWFEPSELRRAADKYRHLDSPPKTPPTPDPSPGEPPPPPPNPEPLPVDPEVDPPDTGSLTILSMLLELVLLILGMFGLR